MAAENRLLRRIIDVTTADLDLRTVARGVAASVTEMMRADVCFVHIVDRERRCLTMIGGTPPFDDLAGTIELAIGEGVAGWVAQHAVPAVVPDKWKDARYKYIPALRGEDFLSMVSVPMVVGSQDVIGVLNVHAHERRSFGEAEVQTLVQVASMLARAVENADLYRRLADREHALERFAATTIETQEMERRRLAGDIHDGISQPLISLWFHLLATEDAALHDPSVLRPLRRAKEMASAALEEARTAISGLRPSVLDDLGLAPSLESLANSIPDVVATVDLDDVDLAPHAQVALYRIAQEALQNVQKHACADNVHLSLSTQDGFVRLLVKDDGAGFEPNARASPLAFGLVGMRERSELVGGQLTVSSRSGRGTTVEVVVPVAFREEL